jgi:hypothetical protein
MSRRSHLFTRLGFFENSRSAPPKALLLIVRAGVVAVLGTSIVSACGPHWNSGGGSHSGGAGGESCTDAGSAGSSADSGGAAGSGSGDAADSSSGDAADSSSADAAGDASEDVGPCVRQSVSVKIRMENGLCLVDLPPNVDHADPLYIVTRDGGFGSIFRRFPLKFDPTTCEPSDSSFDDRLGWAPYSGDTVRICGFLCGHDLPVLYGAWLTCGATRAPGQTEGPSPTTYY